MSRSAYVHIPFCIHRCGYCNFTVVAGRDDLVEPFLDALERELASLGEPHEVDTLFWGGGTPTYLSGSQLDRLIELSRQWLPLAPGGEWSCEANPLDCTGEKLHRLRDAGVTRLSVGGQSFHDAKLKLLERDHSGQQLSETLTAARSIFPDLSLDLIFAAPGETLENWQADLRLALEHGVDHVSTYGLTIEKGSAFFGRQLRGQLASVDEALELEMYQTAIEQLAAAGLEHYEVSNFAKPGHRCRHNEAYWLGLPWLGFGPGAAGFDGRMRTVNHRSLHTYMRRVLAGESPVSERDEIDDEQQVRERFVFGMRRLEGIDVAALATLSFPEPEKLFEPHLSRAVEAGWFLRDGDRIRLSPAGLVISDALWPDFLSG